MIPRLPLDQVDFAIAEHDAAQDIAPTERATYPPLRIGPGHDYRHLHYTADNGTRVTRAADCLHRRYKGRWALVASGGHAGAFLKIRGFTGSEYYGVEVFGDFRDGSPTTLSIHDVVLL